MEKGSECWLADGRKAEYAGEIDGQKFVRIIRSTDDDHGYEEWPDEKLTVVARVYTSEPEEIFGKETQAAQDRIDSLRAEADALRSEISGLKDRKREIEKAAKDYPDISTVLDFIEGRITHVVEINSYSVPRVMTLETALADRFRETREGGLKMLALFGDQRSIHWRINGYSDGSGSWTTCIPARGIDEVRQIIADAANEAVDLWRKGELQIHYISRFGEGEYAATLPEDVQKAIAEKAASAKAARIAEAEKKLAEARAS